MANAMKQQAVKFSVRSEALEHIGSANPYILQVAVFLISISNLDYNDISKIVEKLKPVSEEKLQKPAALYKFELMAGRVYYTSSAGALELLKKLCEINEKVLVESGLSHEAAENYTMEARKYLRVSACA